MAGSEASEAQAREIFVDLFAINHDLTCAALNPYTSQRLYGDL